MKIEPLGLPGAALVRLERLQDERGFFARSACVRELSGQNLRGEFVQSSISWNPRRGTVRGLHLQWPPSREAKLVRCVRGAIHDVLLDLRPGLPTYMSHLSVALDQDNRDAVYVPPGVAHGFQTVADQTEVLYQMTDFYAPELATGVRWNDPAFGIRWPIAQASVIAARDADYPDFSRTAYEAELSRRAAAPGGGWWT
ncbi:MAG: dTDP-4-dehydrorhamnose 3,5-epimerase family protein [Proteobacteria bacterium]|nr:dTDP-4-dehydrorhamnose 3,5-epimerase family protein [Pseudomonadota bacterium]